MFDIFEGTPRDKFYDIIFNANRNLVAAEIDKILERYVAMSELCERVGISEKQIISHAQNAELNDTYIEISGAILSQNE